MAASQRGCINSSFEYSKTFAVSAKTAVFLNFVKLDFEMLNFVGLDFEALDFEMLNFAMLYMLFESQTRQVLQRCEKLYRVKLKKKHNKKLETKNT